MKRHLGIIGLALVSFATGACGSDDGSSSTTTTVSQVTPQQLSAALLTAGDLEGTWTETQRDTFTTREPENPSIDPSLWCPAGNGDALVALAGQAGADVELSAAGDGAYLIRQQAWSNGQVEQYVTAVAAAVDACSGASWTDGDGNTYTLEPLSSVPLIGDASISWTVTIQLAGTPPTSSFAQQTVARFGDVAMVLQGGATPTAGPDAAALNYTVLVRAAADKMAGAIAG